MDVYQVKVVTQLAYHNFHNKLIINIFYYLMVAISIDDHVQWIVFAIQIVISRLKNTTKKTKVKKYLKKYLYFVYKNAIYIQFLNIHKIRPLPA